MTLGKLITQLFRPCSSAPKSPDPPNSPNAACEQAKGDHVIESTPCVDISNMQPGTPSPSANEKGGLSSVVADKRPSDAENTAPSKLDPPESPGTRPVNITQVDHDASNKLILDIFGFEVLHQLQGKQWDERGQAVQAVRARVVQGDMGPVAVEDFFTASCSVAVFALKDKVMPVFFDGLDLAKLLLGDFASKNTLTKEVLNKQVDTIIPIVVGKTSDRNARSIEGTRQALVFFARQSTVGCQQAVAHMLTPITNTKDLKAIQGRLELIDHMIGEFGFAKTGGLSLSSVMAFVRPHLDAPDEKVRRAAVEVTVSSYKLKGDRTMKYCSNLKPALLKLLEQRFAEVDGKSGKSSAKKSLPAVRGVKKRAPLRNGSSGSSRSSGSMGSRSKALAPLELGSTEGRLSNQNSRESRRGEDPLLEDKSQADIFAPVYNDVLRSPAVSSSPFIMSDPMADADCGAPMDPLGRSSLATHEDPNYIPSPTGPSSDPFSGDDEAFMNEIEGL